MAYSYIEYTANGSTTTFSIPFAYTQQADVAVFVGGTSTSFTFASSSTISLSTAPASGVVVRIARTTPITTRAVDFSNGAILTESDLDNSNIQVFQAAQEAIDTAASSIFKTADGKFDDFKTGIPATLNDADKKKLYLEVRKNMGIREEREMGDDYDSLRDAYLTGKIWNVGESVEANGISGEVVRKGTNYLSFVAEDGKVHKAWLHEIESPDIKKGDTIILSKGKRKYSMAGITDPKTTLPAESDKMVVQKITKSKKGRKAHLTYHDTKKRGGFAIYIDQFHLILCHNLSE